MVGEGIIKTATDLHIYKRTDFGNKELSNTSGGLLPREARALLILLDGRKNFGHIAESLQQRKMYQDSGGVHQFLDLLLDLEFVELVLHNERSAQSRPTQQFATSDTEEPATNDIVIKTKIEEKEVGFDRPNSAPAVYARTTPSQTTTADNESFEKLRSTVASLIGNNTREQDSWGMLLKLEGCKNKMELFDLLKGIEQTADGKLSKAVGKVIKILKTKNG